MQARTSRSLLATIATFAAIVALSVASAFAQGPADPGSPTDPPGRAARISVIQGNVSLEPAGVDTFSAAEPNYPLTTGDRVYADLQALSEVETAGLAVRLANGADLTLTTLTDQVAQFGLAQGSIRVNVRDLIAPDGSTGVVELDTPNGAIVIRVPSDVRIDSYPQDGTTVVTVFSGQAEVSGANLDQMLGANQSLQLAGTNPVTAQFVGLLPADALDNFDQSRESDYQAAFAAQNPPVSPDTIGAEDLATYGDWVADPTYGNVWYPQAVPAGWVPYHNGRWVYVNPWGWTWVEAEPWGFAPFHYGRWAVFNGRWGWIPGPPPLVLGRRVRPVYSPALVAFVGAPGLSLTAWFPLGPGEVFVPWYATSAVYVNRINVTNIYSNNTTIVRANYSNRTTIAYAQRTNTVYANRTLAVSAVPQADFAAGHAVASVRVAPAARAQLNQAAVMARPTVAAPAPTAITRAPARVAPAAARPQLPTRATVANTPRSTAPVSTPTPVRPAPGRPATPAPSAPQPRSYQPAPSQPAPTPTRPAAPVPVETRPTQPTAAPIYRAPQPTAQPTPQPAAQPETPVQPAPRQPEQRQPEPRQPEPQQQTTPRQQPEARPQPQPQPQTQTKPAPPAKPAPKPAPKEEPKKPE